MMNLILLSTIVVFSFTALLYTVLRYQRRKIGTLANNKFIYSDTQKKPAQVLYSHALRIKGKPDYLLQMQEMVIPVEVKTGKTPAIPYINHVMQLITYCALVEENYNKRPTHGIVKYPEKEFVIEYTEQHEEMLSKYIEQIQLLKETNVEPECTHPQHQVN